MRIPEGASEEDFKGRAFAAGSIGCNPNVVREWFVSVRLLGRRYFIAAGKSSWFAGPGRGAVHLRWTNWVCTANAANVQKY